MTTPAFVQVPPDSPGGKKVDTVLITTSAGTVERQVVVFADPTDPAGYAAVLTSAPTGTEHALVVRPIGGDGTDATGVAAPAGAVGIRGWLSGIYKLLTGTLLVDGSAHVQPISGTVTVIDSAPLSVSGTVTVGNPTANPETGLAKDATLTSGAVRVGGTTAISAAALPLPVNAAQENTLERRFGTPGTPKKAKGALLSTAGDNDFITPTAGKSVRVLWVSAIPSSDNTAANLVQVKFGTGGTPFYTVYAVGHWEVFEGAVDQHVFVNLANTQPVAVTVHYEEY